MLVRRIFIRYGFSDRQSLCWAAGAMLERGLAQKMDARIVCIGDSITWGFPYGPEYSWVRISSLALGIPMINRGINGETAADLLQRFKEDVLDLKPSHVFILVGANDASIKVPLSEYSEAVENMYSQAVANNISVILGLPIPTADRWLEFTMEKYRVWLRDFASQKGILLVDFSGAMWDGDFVYDDYFIDEVHPSKSGYRVMADVFVKAFKPDL